MKRILAVIWILLATACSGTDAGRLSASVTDTIASVPDGMHRLTLHTNGHVDFYSIPAGLHCPGSCFADFPAGQQVRVDLALAQGQCAMSIDSDPVGCVNASNCSVVMDQDRDITWRTQECFGRGQDAGNSVGADAGPPAQGQHRLTVALKGPVTGVLVSSPAGISCPGQCAADYDEDAIVRLSLASPTAVKVCFPPDGVQGCLNISNCSVKMDADHAVSWTFATCAP